MRSAQRAGLFSAARTIVWAFLGIGHGRRAHHESRLTPLQLIVAGLLGGAMFVLALLALVSAIVRTHGAAT